VDYYGSPTPLNQVASCNVADARTITIKPWEKSIIGDIEKAIMATDIGITPNSDGTVIRLPIPALTVERRKDLVKQVKKLAEASKVTVRNSRRDFKTQIDESDIPEDDQHKALKKLQDLTDAFIAKIDKIAEEKEKEILEQ
jgi:ribosome recycling factor